MATYHWPADLPPFFQSFYLQGHSGGSESPFTRQTKTYGLSAPRWVTRVQFRGGYDGLSDQPAFGPRLDAFLAGLNGREHNVIFWDFRREGGAESWSSSAVAAGATTVSLTGGAPEVGWYVGGDGRPHIVRGVEESSGTYTVTVSPPFARDLGAGEVIFDRPWGLFKLVSDDAGVNGVTVGDVVTYDFELVEHLNGPELEGTPTALEILSVDGDWETIQWYVDDVAIEGATGTSFELTPGDEGAVVKALVGLEGRGAIFTQPTREVRGYDFSTYFSGGIGGGWWDPSDLGTLWADTAGTTPATVGGAVARMDDKSGNGNHLVQSTSGSRPILRQHDEGTHYLEFDGSDDFMRATFTHDQPFDWVAAVRPITWTNNDTLIGGAASSLHVLLQQNNATPQIRMWAGSNTTPGLAPTLNNTIILHARYSGNQSRLRVYPDPPHWAQTGSNNADGITLGANGSDTGNANMAFYGMIARDVVLSDIEIDRYASYLRTRRPLPAANYIKDYFAWNGLTMPWYSRATSYNAKHNPLTNKTWFTWEGGRAGSDTRQIFVNVYDHGAGRWSGMYFVGTGGLTNDDHGVSSIEFLPDGRVICLFGAHNTPMKVCVTTNPDDPSTWTALTDLGDYYTYPHPHLIGGDLYLFMRYTPGGTTAGGELPLHIFKSTAISGTSITWGSPTSVITFGADSRVYNLRNIIVDGKIHMLVQRSTIIDVIRYNFFYFVYDPVSNSFSNIDGSHTTTSANFPIDWDEANDHYRIVETETDEYNHADWCIDELTGLRHVVYSNLGKWWHVLLDPADGTTSTATELVNQTGGYQLAVQALPEGGCQFVYSEDDADNYVNGGNIRMITIDAEGVPGSSVLIQTPPGSDFLYQAAPVGYPHPDARFIWAECEQDESNERGTLRMYCYGQNGFLKRRYA